MFLLILGIHRNFEHSISRVKSLRMDTKIWTPSLVEVGSELFRVEEVIRQGINKGSQLMKTLKVAGHAIQFRMFMFMSREAFSNLTVICVFVPKICFDILFVPLFREIE